MFLCFILANKTHPKHTQYHVEKWETREAISNNYGGLPQQAQLELNKTCSVSTHYQDHIGQEA